MNWKPLSKKKDFQKRMDPGGRPASPPTYLPTSPSSPLLKKRKYSLLALIRLLDGNNPPSRFPDPQSMLTITRKN